MLGLKPSAGASVTVQDMLQRSAQQHLPKLQGVAEGAASEAAAQAALDSMPRQWTEQPLQAAAKTAADANGADVLALAPANAAELQALAQDQLDIAQQHLEGSKLASDAPVRPLLHAWQGSLQSVQQMLQGWTACAELHATLADALASDGDQERAGHRTAAVALASQAQMRLLGLLADVAEHTLSAVDFATSTSVLEVRCHTLLSPATDDATDHAP